MHHWLDKRHQKPHKHKKRINLFMGCQHVRYWGARLCLNSACIYLIAFGPVCNCGTPTIAMDDQQRNAA